MSRNIQGAFMIFLGGTLLCCLCSGVWFGSSEMGVINKLASFTSSEFSMGVGYSVPSGISAYWDATVTVLFWNYPFLDSPWCIFIKFWLWICSIAVVRELVLMGITVMTGLIGVFRQVVGI